MSKNPVNEKADHEKVETILMVSEYYPPHWTGLSKSFHILANHLHQEQGHTVNVLTTHFDKNTPTQEDDNGIGITRAPYQFKISRTHYSFSILWAFIKMLPSHSIVIVNSPNSNILFYSIFTKMFGKKLIIYHQADILLPKQTGNQVLHFLIDRIFEIVTIPSVLLADTISSFTKDYAVFSRVLRYGLHKFVAYIPRVELSDGRPSKALAKRLDTLAGDHVLIGISGRFVEEKGFDILFESLPDILKRIPNAHIIFAGKQIVEYEPFYERHKALFEKHQKNVTYLGFLEGADLAYFYEKLNVFVLSSRIECFALTQIEAVRKHVPIVVTDVAGARMLVKESGFGQIAQAEDPIVLAEAIVEVARNNQAYQQKYPQAVAFLKRYERFRVRP